MRILVMGAGAIGSVVGGFMAKAGHRVALVGRAAHMEAIRARGLRITGIWGEHLVKPGQCDLTVHTDVCRFRPGDFDLVIVTVKSYDTAAVMREVAPLVDAGGLVCSYQNGLGNAECIAAAVGWPRTVGARTIFGVWLPQDGHAEVTVIANPTALGVYGKDAPAERVRALASAMNDAGLPTVYTEAIETALWSKVAYNCALNPMSALLDVPYGAIAEAEYTRAIVSEVVQELYAVGGARGVRLEPGSPADYLDLFYGKLLPPTSGHYASMREDFRRHRRTEIEALNGAICRYGLELGIATPVNQTLTRLVHAREAQYR